MGVTDGTQRVFRDSTTATFRDKRDAKLVDEVVLRVLGRGCDSRARGTGDQVRVGKVSKNGVKEVKVSKAPPRSPTAAALAAPSFSRRSLVATCHDVALLQMQRWP